VLAAVALKKKGMCAISGNKLTFMQFAQPACRQAFKQSIAKAKAKAQEKHSIA